MNRNRAARWFIGAALALVVAGSMFFGQSKPTTVYGADPTPTPTMTTNGDPGSGGGNGRK